MLCHTGYQGLRQTLVWTPFFTPGLRNGTTSHPNQGIWQYLSSSKTNLKSICQTKCSLKKRKSSYLINLEHNTFPVHDILNPVLDNTWPEAFQWGKKKKSGGAVPSIMCIMRVARHGRWTACAPLLRLAPTNQFLFWPPLVWHWPSVVSESWNSFRPQPQTSWLFFVFFKTVF